MCRPDRPARTRLLPCWPCTGGTGRAGRTPTCAAWPVGALRSRTRARIPVSSLGGDPAPGAFSLGHVVLADLMAALGVEPGLLPAAFLRQPACGGRPLGLQSCPDALLGSPGA